MRHNAAKTLAVVTFAAGLVALTGCGDTTADTPAQTSASASSSTATPSGDASGEQSPSASSAPSETAGDAGSGDTKQAEDQFRKAQQVVADQMRKGGLKAGAATPAGFTDTMTSEALKLSVQAMNLLNEQGMVLKSGEPVIWDVKATPSADGTIKVVACVDGTRVVSAVGGKEIKGQAQRATSVMKKDGGTYKVATIGGKADPTCVKK